MTDKRMPFPRKRGLVPAEAGAGISNNNLWIPRSSRGMTEEGVIPAKAGIPFLLSFPRKWEFFNLSSPHKKTPQTISFAGCKI